MLAEKANQREPSFVCNTKWEHEMQWEKKPAENQ